MPIKAGNAKAISTALTPRLSRRSRSVSAMRVCPVVRGAPSRLERNILSLIQCGPAYLIGCDQETVNGYQVLDGAADRRAQSFYEKAIAAGNGRAATALGKTY